MYACHSTVNDLHPLEDAGAVYLVHDWNPDFEQLLAERLSTTQISTQIYVQNSDMPVIKQCG